jgi:hypothetical protein
MSGPAQLFLEVCRRLGFNDWSAEAPKFPAIRPESDIGNPSLKRWNFTMFFTETETVPLVFTLRQKGRLQRRSCQGDLIMVPLALLGGRKSDRIPGLRRAANREDDRNLWLIGEHIRAGAQICLGRKVELPLELPMRRHYITGSYMMLEPYWIEGLAQQFGRLRREKSGIDIDELRFQLLRKFKGAEATPYRTTPRRIKRANPSSPPPPLLCEGCKKPIAPGAKKVVVRFKHSRHGAATATDKSQASQSIAVHDYNCAIRWIHRQQNRQAT